VSHFPILMALVGQNHVVFFLIVGFLILTRVPWLIAAFRVAIDQRTRTELSGRARRLMRSSPAGTGSGRNVAEATA